VCRNIKMLYNFEPPATDDEIRGEVGTVLKYICINRLLQTILKSYGICEDEVRCQGQRG